MTFSRMPETRFRDGVGELAPQGLSPGLGKHCNSVNYPVRRDDMIPHTCFDRPVVFLSITVNRSTRSCLSLRQPRRSFPAQSV